MLHNVNVFGEHLKHVIQIPCKDFEEKRWLELMYMRLPAPLHYAPTGLATELRKLGQPASALEEKSPLTCHELSNSHQVKGREDHFQSETDWIQIVTEHRIINPTGKQTGAPLRSQPMAGSAWEDKEVRRALWTSFEEIHCWDNYEKNSA